MPLAVTEEVAIGLVVDQATVTLQLLAPDAMVQLVGEVEIVPDI
jgi:hypothetical protein